MENFNLREVPRLIASILIVFFSGAVGSLATFPEITTWYAALAKPAWTPPNEWFGPIWTTLYILIGIALFLVWRQGWDRRDVRFAIGIFAVQLVLNILWSLVFFGLHSILGGFIIIFLLWIAILANMVAFYVLSKPAGLLFVPYIIWVSIASYLNYSVMLLN
ncbi:TspO/MBR family protein [Methanobacterium formicicum]|uniref:TspO and MBR-like protein n=1 Tax=Methanobacterium formicicum TaxID=2162 RepID=A0A089ZA49_METFO|nr:TspO/MBR family protein [Methanobacterium formicicum]AIS31676.1 TspO/MBR family protein [Methanobacterium formicicum]MDG3548100.1 tryptophan-rich sensory protein [Methanobacterium formicicum]CEL25540.1 TspO and MBR-like protein [Methanobacterium formicicum]